MTLRKKKLHFFMWLSATLEKNLFRSDLKAFFAILGCTDPGKVTKVVVWSLYEKCLHIVLEMSM